MFRKVPLNSATDYKIGAFDPSIALSDLRLNFPGQIRSFSRCAGIAGRRVIFAFPIEDVEASYIAHVDSPAANSLLSRPHFKRQTLYVIVIVKSQ